MSWRFFIGACILVGYGMLAAGAPVGTVALGIFLSAIINFIRRRQSGRV